MTEKMKLKFVNFKIKIAKISYYSRVQSYSFPFGKQLDKQDIHPVVTLAYLKKLLISHVWKSKDGFSFASEGCSRIESILLGKSVKPVIGAKVYIKCITSLPVIKDVHSPSKKNSFYLLQSRSFKNDEKLSYLKSCFCSQIFKFFDSPQLGKQ